MSYLAINSKWKKSLKHKNAMAVLWDQAIELLRAYLA